MKGRTAKGNELSPAKMPLMRIRSVEIVFEDEMSTCTDTAMLDRSIELIVSDSSDDSTKCVDDLVHLHVEKDDSDDSVTLNADADLSDDNISVTKELVDDRIATDDPPQLNDQHFEDNREQVACVALPSDENTLSQNISELGDSGRFTEDACSSHVEVPILTYDDALLSHSFDVVNVDESSTVASLYELSEASANMCDRMCELSEAGANMCDRMCELSEVSTNMYERMSELSEVSSNMYERMCELSEIGADGQRRLFEYVDVDSNSDSSDNTAVCDGQSDPKLLTSSQDADMEDTSLCDSSDLQYDSFVDMGKF